MGVCWCVWVCAGVLGCAQVCSGVRGCAWSCTGARKCTYMYVGVIGCVWYAWVCMGVCGSVRKCEGVCKCVCWMNFQNIFWRLDSIHQRTLIRILYEFFYVQNLAPGFQLHLRRHFVQITFEIFISILMMSHYFDNPAYSGELTISDYYVVELQCDY